MDKASYTVRRAAESDISAVIELLRQVCAVHHEGRPDLFRLAQKYTADELRGIFADVSRPVFVAVDGGDTVAGYAFCVMKRVRGDKLMQDNLTVYIDDLCVDESLRGHGIGTLLFTAVKAFALSQGAHNITLNVWSCNPAANAFYESLGMTEQKRCMEMIL